MERHHFAQAIAIVNSEGCNIFETFSRKDYTTMLDLIREIILATDMAHHIKIFPEIQQLVKAYNKDNIKHRNLLLFLMMTTCDLNDQTKGWVTTIRTAELIYKEFFSQGDLEKAMGNRPIDMMDRDKAFVPDLQINFMEHICIPTYNLLNDIFPKAALPCLQVKSNHEEWRRVAPQFTFTGLPSSGNLDFLMKPEITDSPAAAPCCPRHPPPPCPHPPATITPTAWTLDNPPGESLVERQGDASAYSLTGRGIGSGVPVFPGVGFGDRIS
ncbi:cGMP-dependent 3',5'-cyclic phosphodiesterase-like [Leucoraja erinacea]|uniref:cGMP-dependent 3',5'-cyclic phosphodiesterase-like n=1 Tax=Leucoraja erinaceus TaxID=7782 RepID=UPI0024567398|nr:cGMP-dependent 3',5'-cyclic phosphodiesterase-like [Leucoraja erinacea]